MMVEEGVLQNPDVDAIFGLHIWSQIPVGQITYRPEGMMAASNRFTIDVRGKQTYGSSPWDGIDPIIVSAQIINGLQTIISQRTELTKEAAVITVGIIRSGVRHNIIPEDTFLEGTIRTLDQEMQDKLFDQMHTTVDYIARSMGAKANLEIHPSYPVTYNHHVLIDKMAPTLERVVGEENAIIMNPITYAENFSFSFFQKEVPGFYFFVGGMPPEMDPEEAPAHHTPDFYIDEEGMKTGVRAMATLAVDYMKMQN